MTAVKRACSDDARDRFSPEEFAAWSDRLQRLVMPIVRDEEAARDICQEVWVRFMEKRPEDLNLGGWLATVARRLALNHVASGAVRFRAPLSLDDAEPPSTGPTPADVFGQTEEAVLISEVLGSLKPRHREIIRLCDREGLSYAEAGRRMDLSESAVTSLLFRARKAFRRRYLLAVAPPWLRALAETGSIDEVLQLVDPFAARVELDAAAEIQAHNLFAHLAARWDSIRRDTVPEGLDTAVTERAGLTPEDWALDAGTGTGAVAMHLARLVRRVVGIDRSMPMLKVARERAAESGSANVLMEYGDLNRLAVKEQSFDVAFCSLVLRHVQHPEGVVKGIARALRPGGRLVVCDRLRPSRKEPGLDPALVRRWLAEAGLEKMSLDEVEHRAGARYLIAVAHRTRP